MAQLRSNAGSAQSMVDGGCAASHDARVLLTTTQQFAPELSCSSAKSSMWSASAYRAAPVCCMPDTPRGAPRDFATLRVSSGDILAASPSIALNVSVFCWVSKKEIPDHSVSRTTPAAARARMPNATCFLETATTAAIPGQGLNSAVLSAPLIRLLSIKWPVNNSRVALIKN